MWALAAETGRIKAGIQRACIEATHLHKRETDLSEREADLSEHEADLSEREADLSKR